MSAGNGLARATGSFAGTFRGMNGTGSATLSGGTFDVRGLPDVATLR